MEFQNLRRLQSKAELVLNGPEHFCSLLWVKKKSEKYFLVISIYLSNWHWTDDVFSVAEYVRDSTGYGKCNELIIYLISYLPEIIWINDFN